ncbi:hypothetical protein BDQ17DRAFT_1223425, partial [Cyathus striatus]
ANWLRKPEQAKAVTTLLGATDTFQRQLYPTIIRMVSTTFDPTEKSHIDELIDRNGITTEEWGNAWWIKPIEQRRPDQKFAHLEISLANDNKINELITRGIIICNMWQETDKKKKEPTRCLKCQGWNHIAKTCSQLKDTCGTCGGEHWTSTCNVQGKQWCVSCNNDSHCSWDRSCPSFKTKCNNMDKHNPEASLPYYPSEVTYTWMPAIHQPQENTTYHSWGQQMYEAPIQELPRGREPGSQRQCWEQFQ